MIPRCSMLSNSDLAVASFSGESGLAFAWIGCLVGSMTWQTACFGSRRASVSWCFGIRRRAETTLICPLRQRKRAPWRSGDLALLSKNSALKWLIVTLRTFPPRTKHNQSASISKLVDVACSQKKKKKQLWSGWSPRWHSALHFSFTSHTSHSSSCFWGCWPQKSRRRMGPYLKSRWVVLNLFSSAWLNSSSVLTMEPQF